MKRIKFSIPLLAVVSIPFFLPRIVSTHEPITTKVMFNKEVIRILERNCLGCHAEGKIKTDIPLTTYEEARPWAKAIKEEVLEKRMVPYQAVKGYGSFTHDYALAQRDVELLVSWIEGGAPRGDVKDYPNEQIQKLIGGKQWTLGQPDLVLQPEIKTRPAAEARDETHCLSMPLGIKEDRFITAFDFQPGNGAIVHSASFAIVPRASKKRCDADLPGFAQWVPGQSAIRLPEGFGYPAPAGSLIVMKIRYRKNGEPVTDRSRVGLYFAKSSIAKAVRSIAIAPSPASIVLANESGFRAKATFLVNEPTEAVAIRPILFPLAKSIEAAAVRPDGTIEVLIWAKNYRFDWQPSYYFKKPIALPKGTRIEVTAYIDNSDGNPNNPNDPPAEVRLKDALCELALSSTPPAKTASLSRIK